MQILCQPAGNTAPIPVAKQAIKIEELPWNSDGQVPGVLVNLEDLTEASGLMRWFNPNGAVDKAKQVRCTLGRAGLGFRVCMVESLTAVCQSYLSMLVLILYTGE